MSVRSSRCLEWTDILAEINGTAGDDQVRAHLAACADCRAELSSWAAIASGVRHLADGIQVPTGANLEPAPPLQHRRLQAGRRGLAAVAVAAAVVAALLVVLLPGHSRLTRPLHTAWAAAHMLPQEAVGTGAPAGGWRLTSYLVSAGWQQSTAGPEPGYLTCSSARTCYVEGDNATSASGPADMDSFYVTHDHGLSWSVLPLPTGLTFASALSCGSEADCAAGGLYRGQPVFVRTGNGGHSWTVEPLPAGANGLIFQLNCPTATMCGGLLTTSSAPLPVGQQYYAGVTFLRTTDGGRHFATSAFSAQESMQALSCPTATDCVAVGVSSSDVGGTASASATSFVAATADGGATWRQGALPHGFGLSTFPQVTCPDAGHCFVLGTSNPRTGYSDIAMSADGGRTWIARPLPAALPQPFLSQISCPTSSTCYASGTEAVAQRINGSINGGSAMILATNDAGAHWSRTTFPAPAQVPTGMQLDAFMDIGGIQCTQVNVCVALGVSDQGSRSTPVYTDGTTP
ncbi:MAG TPA: hypothetical protein VLM11_07735 [Streptosporangiaceae bacterium]|nr:hypothetical protein [Streptosporangiaceae bacterium]